jgi:uncharacterized protein YraI
MGRSPRSLLAAVVLSLFGCGPQEDGDAPLDFEALRQAITANYAAGATVTATVDTALRQGPGTLYTSLLTIPAGAKVKLAASGAPTDAFYKITYGAKTGWAYGKNLRSPTAVYGYYPDARDSFLQLGITSSRVSQTIGNAVASAGYHAADGTVNGVQYCAATDVRTIGLTESQIRSTLESMARLGLAGWYRKPGFDGWPSSEAPHIHVVFAGAPMKSQLSAQVSDWLVGKNGLTSHTTYQFYTWSSTAKDAVKRLRGLLPAPTGKDTDGDGKLDFVDNCPRASNASQLDTDGDGLGDVCDTDKDNDGRADATDNCPTTKNADQADLDGDKKGDACDTDDDGDGAPDTTDNCPRTANASQADLDGDKIGDACELDDDGDGAADATDNCPTLSNPGQVDLDADGAGDACDLDDDADGVPDAADDCPAAADPQQADLDGDGAGDACDLDADGDDVPDAEDNCPGAPNAAQDDDDANGVGDACEQFVLPPEQQEAPPDDAPVPHGDGEEDVEATVGCAAAPAQAFAALALLLLRRRRSRP